ncbi:ABC transporter ATP-binding protein [Corynebacterium pseudodiphtheriticum]|uniref:ATP-binding cassette domain-containing protein n=1 Tax=Corynebacterium pseudodiphtheriticum TaxID=37637 RepID=UPI0025433524|nr:ABC transporter ATP-binding protein [Corynebacterium pseudodiphtheriticum]MDK4242491.1 ABC transporter ATP-binding protein [Corynebacterium pseudodiphtheriticum]
MMSAQESTMSRAQAPSLLAVHALQVHAGDKVLVNDLSFSLRPGQRLGIIGESGSGKSLTALALLGLCPRGVQATGSICIDGEEMLAVRRRARRQEKRWGQLRGTRIGMVFQEPMSALDPLMKIGRMLGHNARQLLAEVGLEPDFVSRFPFELSGGQRQRVLLALAISQDPDILVCDEPTTALDVLAQDEVLGVIERLVRERDMALLFISHDLDVIQRMCNDVLVLHKGHVVERGASTQVFQSPREPYTKQLLAASRYQLPARTAGTKSGSQGSFSALAKADPIIELEGVTHAYGTTPVLRNISLQVRRGKRLGIVGASGSGKSTLLKLIAGLEAPTTGNIEVKAGVQMVFQDPFSSLNPRLRIGRIIAEGGGSDERSGEILAEVGLPTDATGRLPHEFSGGQRQRISIARSVAGHPDILLADEAVSALDVSVRCQVLDLLDSLVDDYGLTLVFVSHDLHVVRQICDEVIVMCDGQIVEAGAVDKIWQDPADDYTARLLAAALYRKAAGK